MRKLLLTIGLIIAASVGCTFTDAGQCYARSTKKTSTHRPRQSNHTKFVGTIGKSKVTVFLDGQFNGYYYYGNGSNGKLKLISKYMGGNKYCFYEYDKAGNYTAFWDVEFYPGNRVSSFIGTMTNMSTNKTYNVEISS